jgi:hypothetical protein
MSDFECENCGGTLTCVCYLNDSSFTPRRVMNPVGMSEDDNEATPRDVVWEQSKRPIPLALKEKF